MKSVYKITLKHAKKLINSLHKFFNLSLVCPDRRITFPLQTSNICTSMCMCLSIWIRIIIFLWNYKIACHGIIDYKWSSYISWWCDVKNTIINFFCRTGILAISQIKYTVMKSMWYTGEKISIWLRINKCAVPYVVKRRIEARNICRLSIRTCCQFVISTKNILKSYIIGNTIHGRYHCNGCPCSTCRTIHYSHILIYSRISYRIRCYIYINNITIFYRITITHSTWSRSIPQYAIFYTYVC